MLLQHYHFILGRFDVILITLACTASFLCNWPTGIIQLLKSFVSVRKPVLLTKKTAGFHSKDDHTIRGVLLRQSFGTLL